MLVYERSEYFKTTCRARSSSQTLSSSLTLSDFLESYWFKCRFRAEKLVVVVVVDRWSVFFFSERCYQSLLLSINCSLVLSNSKRTKSVFSIKLNAHERAITKKAPMNFTVTSNSCLWHRHLTRVIDQLLRWWNFADKQSNKKEFEEEKSRRELLLTSSLAQSFNKVWSFAIDAIKHFIVTDNYRPDNWRVSSNLSWRRAKRFLRLTCRGLTEIVDCNDRQEAD